jgi:tRNA(Ile)-lysidine synthase
MALLHVLARLAPSLKFRLTAHGVDHGLRSGAAAELDLAERLCLALGVPFHRTILSLVDGSNLQARARAARYEVLAAAAASSGAEFIVTAHHADDRAETVLLRLLRGAGPRGLAVLAPRSAGLLRPMVRARRADVLAHLERHGIGFATDPSNSSNRFTRVRVRRELLPLLETLSPQIVDHLVSLADALGERLSPQLQEALDSLPSLGRAQRRSLTAATQVRQLHARVSLAGGKRAGVDPTSGLPRLLDTD